MAELTPEEQEALKQSALGEGDESSEPEMEIEPPEPQQEEKPEGEEPEKSKEFQSALAQKEHFRQKAEKLEQELKKYKTPKTSEIPNQGVEDVDKIINITKATKDLESDEIAELRLKAKAKNISLEEARNDDNFKLWLNAKREKVAKEQNIPSPSSPGGRYFPTEEITDDMDEKKIKEIMRKRKEQTKKRGVGI